MIINLMGIKSTIQKINEHQNFAFCNILFKNDENTKFLFKPYFLIILFKND